MKKFLIFILVFITTYTSIFAETGVPCSTPDARCSAYDLDVDVEVLSSFQFIGISPIELGQVSRGETVEVFSIHDYQERGKRGGGLLIYYRSSDNPISLKCMGGSVFFGDTNEESTVFSDCKVNIVASGETSVLYNYSAKTEHYIQPLGMPGEQIQLSLIIGGTILVPNTATIGQKSGSMRIEITYL